MEFVQLNEYKAKYPCLDKAFLPQSGTTLIILAQLIIKLLGQWPKSNEAS